MKPSEYMNIEFVKLLYNITSEEKQASRVFAQVNNRIVSYL